MYEIMNIFLKLKSTKSLFEEYQETNKELVEIRKSLNEEINMNHNTREKFNGELNKTTSDLAKGLLTDKYNSYFSNFLDLVEEKKNEISKLRKRQNVLLESKDGLRRMVDILNLTTKLESNPENFIYKKYFKNSLNRERKTLPQINGDNYDDIIMHFSTRAKVKKEKIKLKDLKPVQTIEDMDNKKIIDLIKNKPISELKFFISKDNYFVDGHHGFCSGLEKDANYKVTCYKIDLSIVELLRRLNIMKVTTKES